MRKVGRRGPAEGKEAEGWLKLFSENIREVCFSYWQPLSCSLSFIGLQKKPCRHGKKSFGGLRGSGGRICYSD